MTEEQKFTLAEAKTELERQECEASGHVPTSFVFGEDSFTEARCKCGQFDWTPKPVSGNEEGERMSEQQVKYPEIEVQLSGEDGNAFAIRGRVSEALRREGVSDAEVEAFRAEAMSGDYDALLRTCARWVSVR